jgi:hypothetical protein
MDESLRRMTMNDAGKSFIEHAHLPKKELQR